MLLCYVMAKRASKGITTPIIVVFKKMTIGSSTRLKRGRLEIGREHVAIYYRYKHITS